MLHPTGELPDGPRCLLLQQTPAKTVAREMAFGKDVLKHLEETDPNESRFRDLFASTELCVKWTTFNES
ncbi:hypothetical protein HPP92_005598 [Vanilla planifolia]|uniref:Uncharacterized protein n=1 Tax=Vanilla planifolia TaxID=51239 RepID=A0A835VBI2_VANPL|nr:hypothetical protein HPP92_005598 [Vanilla planifolia]